MSAASLRAMARSKRGDSLAQEQLAWDRRAWPGLAAIHARAADALWAQAEMLDARAGRRAFHEGRNV